MKIAAIIQARMGSTRLPGKVLLPLGGKTVIEQMVQRAQAVKQIDQVIVATTTSTDDDALVKHLEQIQVPYFRGSIDDVLSRYVGAAEQLGADVIIRITSDDPLKDPIIIEKVLNAYLDGDYDYVSNNNPPSFPEGMDVEVFGIKALHAADQSTSAAYDREHVTPYFYNNPTQFSIHNVSQTQNLSHLRWTLDTQNDYQFLKTLYDALSKADHIISMDEALAWQAEHPEASIINSNEKRSSLYG